MVLMAKSVVLTNIAETDLENLTDYLIENWGRSVCETFIFRFEQVCEIISLNPTIYPVSYQNEKIRKCINPAKYYLLPGKKPRSRDYYDLRYPSGSR